MQKRRKRREVKITILGFAFLVAGVVILAVWPQLRFIATVYILVGIFAVLFGIMAKMPFNFSTELEDPLGDEPAARKKPRTLRRIPPRARALTRELGPDDNPDFIRQLAQRIPKPPPPP